MKHFWKLVSLCVAVVFFAMGALLTGCGSGGSAKIRFVNLSPNSPSFNILVDGKTVTNGLGFGVLTSYMSISSGSRKIEFQAVGTTTDVFAPAEPSIQGGMNYTFLTYDFFTQIKNTILTDNQTAPANGDFQVRIVNAAAALGARDIYFVPNLTDINTVSPTAGNVGLGKDTGYLSQSAGVYQIFFAQPGFKTGYSSTGGITFAQNTNRTIVGFTNQFGAFSTLTLADLN
ncbi:MAG TPA: DUF4397 domain-containing protein [Terriglobales bacterium]|nr:DUF4397 domain-containing protein [Terriglobales bacterium]